MGDNVNYRRHRESRAFGIESIFFYATTRVGDTCFVALQYLPILKDISVE